MIFYEGSTQIQPSFVRLFNGKFKRGLRAVGNICGLAAELDYRRLIRLWRIAGFSFQILR